MQRIKLTLNTLQDIRDFYDITSALPYDVDIGSGSTFYDAKSMLGLLNLRFGETQYLTIYSEEDFSGLFSRWTIQ